MFNSFRNFISNGNRLFCGSRQRIRFVRKYTETEAQLRARRYVERNRRRLWIVGGAIFTSFTSGLSFLNYYFQLSILKEINFSISEVENQEELVLLLSLVNTTLKNSFSNIIWTEFKDGRAINFCVSALEYDGGNDLVKELALRCLSQMSHYDELKNIIISKVDITKVITEATERKNFTTDDIPFHTFIAHYLDDVSVQQIALSVGYLDKLLWLLHSNNTTARRLAIRSISKLSSTVPGCMALANTDAFYTTYQLLYNPSSDPLKTLHRDLSDTMDKTIMEAKVTLRNLYFSPVLSLLKQRWPDGWEYVESRLLQLENFDMKWMVVFDFLRQSAISCCETFFFGTIWGSTRHILRSSIIRGSFKGGLFSGLGATSLVMMYQIKCWFEPEYLKKLKVPALSIAYITLESIAGVIILYNLLPIAPFCVVPVIFGTILRESRRRVTIKGDF